MRILLVILASLFLAVNSFAAVVPTNVSGDTIDFNSTAANVVTFNSATSHVWIWNEDYHDNVYVDFICRDHSSDRKRGFATTNTAKLIKVPRIGDATPNTIDIDISIINLGFISDTGTGTVTYRVTGEQEL